MEQNIPVEGSKEVVQPDVSALERRSKNKAENSEREKVVKLYVPVEGIKGG